MDPPTTPPKSFPVGSASWSTDRRAIRTRVGLKAKASIMKRNKKWIPWLRWGDRGPET